MVSSDVEYEIYVNYIIDVKTFFTFLFLSRFYVFNVTFLQ